MAISNDKVKEIQSIISDLGEIIHSINPITDKEWSVFERLVQAHTALRRADTDALLQLELPLSPRPEPQPKFRKDCPRCGGSGLYRDPDAESNEPRHCNCNDIDNVTWPTVRKEWEEARAPIEV